MRKFKLPSVRGYDLRACVANNTPWACLVFCALAAASFVDHDWPAAAQSAGFLIALLVLRTFAQNKRAWNRWTAWLPSTLKEPRS
ncbi:MAG: hypothetical protein NTW01_03485 [Gammaproteobacteria bacterium]|nr:hypothetical protein [Gammaproteobacteria bacterium]